MRILCIVSDTVRDATSCQRHSLFSGFAAYGHEVKEVTPPLQLLALWQQIRRWQPEVIHVWHPPNILLGQLLKWSGMGNRLVITVMSPPEGKRQSLSPKANRWLVPTEQLGLAWQEWGVSAERIKEIAPGGSISTQVRATSNSRREFLQACDLPTNARLILCSGPMQIRSGHTSALWAADILHYLHPDAYLVIAGTGPDQGKVREFACNIRAERFTRFLDNRFPLSSLMHHADVVWEPTRQDEVTDAAILAQQCGKPLLATSHASLKPLVHPQAVEWLPPHDPPLWAKLTHLLLTDTDRRHAMGQAGQNFAQERFSANTCIARHLKQYERLLATPVSTWLPQAV